MKSCDLAIACWGILLIKIQTTSPFATTPEVTRLLSMLDYTANLTHICVVIVTLVHVVAVLVVAGLHSHLDDTPQILHDVITKMVFDTIRKHGIIPLFQK
jgi:hypothetical protein